MNERVQRDGRLAAVLVGHRRRPHWGLRGRFRTTLRHGYVEVLDMGFPYERPISLGNLTA